MTGQNQPDNELLRAALYYASLGWSVIPIRHRDESGKQPACAAWKQYQTTRPSLEQIKRWFRRKDLDGLAVIFGPVSGGLACRDFDKPGAYDAWVASQPDLAAQLPTAMTARGAHVYFRANLSKSENYSDGELKARGTYCLLPPSKHPTGPSYRWLRDYDLASIPKIDPFAVGLGPPGSERAEESRSNIREIDTPETNLNCSAFSALSVSSEVREYIARAIEKTLPNGPGQRHHAIFRFARELKGIAALADAPAPSMREFVVAWHKRALRFIRTKAFEDTWVDFAKGWDRVEFPAGMGPFADVVRRAETKPVTEAPEGYGSDSRRLMAICRELQASVGSGAFFLSCRTVADVLGLSPMTAWRRLESLEVDGILKVVTPGTKTKAKRYRSTLKA